MGIEKKDPANFSPSVEIPAKVDSFRFWCQKVLPLVYDDSLSYYELLCKVVDYLNNTIADVNTLGTDVDNLNNAYNELQSYVNDYFSTLDVQKEINNKLDVMAKDGTLSALIQPLFDTYKTQIDGEVNKQNNKIVVLENRMNTFTSLPSGSTSGDAELIDIRVPYNGFNNNQPYANAGDAVRGQVGALKTDLDNITDNIAQGIIICVDNNETTTEEESFPYINTISKTITFPKDFARLYSGKKMYLLSNLTLTYDSDFAAIFYDRKNKILKEFDFSLVDTTLSTEYIYIGCIIETTVHMNIYPYYFVNGMKCSKSDFGYINMLQDYPVPKNKYNISILGDSTSTFNSISESEIDGITVTSPYYPHTDEKNPNESILNSDDMWWSILKKKLRINTPINVSAVSQSSYINQNNESIPPMFNTTRINNLSSKSFPYIIFINAGINDAFFAEQGKFEGKWDVATIEKENNTVAKGIELTIRKIQQRYLYTKIVLIIPKLCIVNEPNTFQSRLSNVCDLIYEIGTKYGVYKIIDLRKCLRYDDMNVYTYDGIHPNKSGMKKIANYIANCMFNITD